MMHATTWFERLAAPRASRATTRWPRSTSSGPDAATVLHAARRRGDASSRTASWPRRWPSWTPLAGDDHAACSSTRPADAARGDRTRTRRAPDHSEAFRWLHERVHRGPAPGPGGDMVMSLAAPSVDEAAVRAALAEVADPEIPSSRSSISGWSSVVDVGRTLDPRRAAADVRRLPGPRRHPATRSSSASSSFGRPVDVEFAFRVPWTSDRITPAGRERLRDAGFAPPGLAPLADGAAHPARRAGTVPDVRLESDGDGERLRTQPVPGDPLLHRVSPAVRSDQGRLTP